MYSTKNKIPKPSSSQVVASHFTSVRLVARGEIALPCSQFFQYKI
ncbi:unnamed protein product [Prunus brigantina]